MKEASPPYTVIENAVKAAFEADPNGAQEAVVKVLREQSATVLLRQASDLADTVKILKTSFENVSQALVKVDWVIKEGIPRVPIWQAIYSVSRSDL